MKRALDDLALFGGTPLFATPRPQGQLSRGDSAVFFEHVRSIRESRRLTNHGPLVLRLEEELKRYHQVDHCISFCNACIGLIALFCIAGGARRKGSILMPAFTYAGLPHLAQWAGLEPLFCDIDPATQTLDPDMVRQAVRPDTVAILAVHQANALCRIESLSEVAGQAGVPLIFDSVHGVHCTHGGRPIGRHGMAEVFSLHATKLINGFEGGYVTTNDASLAGVLRRMSHFGFEGKDAVGLLGLNGKLNEVHAAMALASLRSLDATVERNRQRLGLYEQCCNGIPGCRIAPYPEGRQNNFSLVIMETDPERELGRDELVRILRSENAMATPYYSPPLHLSEHMPEGLDAPSLPETEKAADRFLLLPAGDMVGHEDIRRIADLLSFVRQNEADLARRLSA